MPSSRHRRGRPPAQSSRHPGAGASTGGDEIRSDSRLRRLLASPVGIAIAAISALVTALVVGVGQELLPKELLADRLRPGDPISVTVVPSVPQAGVPGAAARERLDSPTMQRAVEAMRPPFPEALGKTQLVPASQTEIVLQLIGRRSQPVEIVGMHIRVLHREAPLTGSFLLGPGPQGGGPDVLLRATVDDPVPRLTHVVQGTDTQEPFFASHHISLMRGESVPVALFITAGHGYCEWDLAVDYLADGKAATLFVGRNGVVHGERDDRPFAISALPPRIHDYGVVYTFPAQTVGDSYYKRITADQYCPAVRRFYSNAYRERALESWAC